MCYKVLWNILGSHSASFSSMSIFTFVQVGRSEHILEYTGNFSSLTAVFPCTTLSELTFCSYFRCLHHSAYVDIQVISSLKSMRLWIMGWVCLRTDIANHTNSKRKPPLISMGFVKLKQIIPWGLRLVDFVYFCLSLPLTEKKSLRNKLRSVGRLYSPKQNMVWCQNTIAMFYLKWTPAH